MASVYENEGAARPLDRPSRHSSSLAHQSLRPAKICPLTDLRHDFQGQSFGPPMSCPADASAAVTACFTERYVAEPPPTRANAAATRVLAIFRVSGRPRCAVMFTVVMTQV